MECNGAHNAVATTQTIGKCWYKFDLQVRIGLVL